MFYIIFYLERNITRNLGQINIENGTTPRDSETIIIDGDFPSVGSISKDCINNKITTNNQNFTWISLFSDDGNIFS